MFDKFSNITFEYPYFLGLIFVFVFCSYFCKEKTQSYYIPHLDILKNSKTLKSNFSNILKWIVIVFSIIALASPIKELNVINSKKDGIDMVLALDTSGSMRQVGFNRQNIEQNRWDVVKDIVGDFIKKRVNDNIALVVFGTSVMTASPLSYDKEAQKKIINGLDIAVVGERTALIDSIASSINILKNKETKSKVIIALTDGEDTASSIPLNVVVKMAKKYNIKIYTIAIGSAMSYVLEKLSNETKAKSFVALSKKDLKKVYETIDKLEKSDIEQNKIVLKEYLFFYPLFISFISLLLFIFFKNKRGM